MSTTMENMTDGIARANHQFEATFNAGDPAAAARGVYTREARVLPPGGPPVQGLEAIAAFWDGAARQMGIQEVRLSTVELTPLGDGAYELGNAQLTLAGGQSVAVKYVVIWKQEGGNWKWHVDIWNANA